MNQKSAISSFFAYNSIAIGLAIYIVWLFRVRNVFFLNASDLPIKSELLPAQGLYWIAIILMLVPFTITSLPKAARITSLGAVLFILLFSFPLHSPFGLPNGRDPQYSLQAAELVSELGSWDPTTGTGQAKSYNNYPGLIIYHVIFSKLSGLDMVSTVMWGIAIMRFLLFPVLIYLICKQILKKEEYAITTLLVYFTNPSLTNHPHYEGMAIIFTFAAFYLLFISEQRDSWGNLFLSIIFGIIIIITHHFTSYLFFAWIGALIFLSILAKILLKFKLDFNFFKTAPGIFKPGVFFVVFTALLAVWSLTYGESHFIYYTQDLESSIFARINPVVEPIPPDEAPLPIRSAPPVQAQTIQKNEYVLSLAATTESPQFIRAQNTTSGTAMLKAKAVFDNVKESINRIMDQIRSGNFADLEIYTIGLAVIIIAVIAAFGFFPRIRDAEFVEVGNAIVFGGVMAIAVLLVVIARFNIIPRMFEFTYLGFITFITAGLYAISAKFKATRQIVFTSVLVIMFISGNLLLSGGQQRALYVPPEKVTLDSSQMFLTPATYEMTQWTKNNFEFKQVAGETFIFDTVGAYGRTDVHYYEPVLIRGVYRASAISDSTRFRLKWDKIDAIFTHKYLKKYRSAAGGPYTLAAVQKFDNYYWLNRVYDSSIIQAYSVEEHIAS